MKLLILPAQLESLRTRKDRTLTLMFGTQEISPDNGRDLFAINGQMVYLALKVEEFTKGEVELLDNLKADIDDMNLKTPGQRLRGVFYRLYEQNPEGFKSFTLYYDAKMEHLIKHYRDKIE